MLECINSLKKTFTKVNNFGVVSFPHHLAVKLLTAVKPLTAVKKDTFHEQQEMTVLVL